MFMCISWEVIIYVLPSKKQLYVTLYIVLPLRVPVEWEFQNLTQSWIPEEVNVSLKHHRVSVLHINNIH